MRQSARVCGGEESEYCCDASLVILSCVLMVTKADEAGCLVCVYAGEKNPNCCCHVSLNSLSRALIVTGSLGVRWRLRTRQGVLCACMPWRRTRMLLSREFEYFELCANGDEG